MVPRVERWKTIALWCAAICVCAVVTYIKVPSLISSRLPQYIISFRENAHKFKQPPENFQPWKDNSNPAKGDAEKKESAIEDGVKFLQGPKRFSSNNARNRRSVSTPVEDFSFSEWGLWTTCSSKNCKVGGTQWKSRTCFGNNIHSQRYHQCTYENLVRSRPCYPEGCADPGDEKLSSWNNWTSWSQCSITCGVGGMQTRARLCVAENSQRVSSSKCSGRSVQGRGCQYSTSCPLLREWSTWSPCQATCGRPGVSHRSRKCFVFRYISGRSTDTAESAGESEVRRNGTSPQGKHGERTGTIILLNGSPVFVVDARQDISSNELTLNMQSTAKEIIDNGKCLDKNEPLEDQRQCPFQDSCPSKWGPWQEWSACRRGCSPGFRKRERMCVLNSKKEPCQGQKALYRRCYPPPCWSTWETIGRCSATCGLGLLRRVRKCLLYSALPPYDKCIGSPDSVVNCSVKACSNECWTNWAPFTTCTVSCNSGFQFRNRTCICSSCQGDSNEVKLCNKQRCPTWSRWGAYSCCSVTCGTGVRSRMRSCAHGKIGDEGCVGVSSEMEVCYRPTCQQIKTSALETASCGTRALSTLRIAHLRIFGGVKSVAHGWPWQASWQHRIDERSNWKHLCGASLIHPRWVVTAAHCIEETPYSIQHDDPGLSWSVVLGMHRLNEDGTRFFAEKIFVHEEYSHELVTFHDIALVKLRRMASVTEHVSPICLPNATEPQPGQLCYVSGWGFTKPRGNHSELLREASIPVVDFEACRTLGDYYRYFLTRNVHMCAGNPIQVKNDSCSGDSGGPLSCKNGNRWYLAAVTSFSFAECGTQGHSGIYTPVTGYEKWIRDIVEFHTYEKC